jgi:hypothetical protein
VTGDPGKHVVDPKLFDFVTKYAGQIKSGQVNTKGALKKETAIVYFASNFFLQFFKNVLDTRIISVDAQAKAQAVDLRTSLTNHQAEKQLIVQFERLVDIWPDILGAGYGGSEIDYQDFHRRYVPRLLNRIAAWAKTTRDQPLISSAQEALSAYADAIKAVPVA